MSRLAGDFAQDPRYALVLARAVDSGLQSFAHFDPTAQEVAHEKTSCPRPSGSGDSARNFRGSRWSEHGVLHTWSSDGVLHAWSSDGVLQEGLNSNSHDKPGQGYALAPVAPTAFL